MAITPSNVGVSWAGGIPIDTLDVDTSDGTTRKRQAVAIGHPDKALAGRYLQPDANGAAPTVLWDASGNPLLTKAAHGGLTIEGVASGVPVAVAGSSGNALKVAPSDAQAATDLLASASMRWNGTNWDRWYNANQSLVLLASAARTTTAVGSFTNYNWGGIALALNVTSIPGSAPSLQVYVQAAGGILCPLDTAVTATGLYIYIYAPGSTATPYGAVNGVQAIHAVGLPGGTVNPVVVHGNANSVTYTLTGFPIVNS